MNYSRHAAPLWARLAFVLLCVSLSAGSLAAAEKFKNTDCLDCHLDPTTTRTVNGQTVKLDRDPPFAPSPGGATPLPTNPSLYDQVGRYFRLGVKLRY